MAEHCLIVGLGNPGKAYEETRHNIGFQIVRAFANKNGFVFRQKGNFIGDLAQGQQQDKKVILLLPMTYMNSSGQAVKLCVDYFEVVPERILVVCDDIALPFEELRLRLSGSAGGHNGLKSIEAHLGMQNYARLKVGIGETRGALDLADYVLSRFAPAECDLLPKVVERAVSVLDLWISQGPEVAVRKAAENPNRVLTQASMKVNKKTNDSSGQPV